jgi:hypothetical protein
MRSRTELAVVAIVLGVLASPVEAQRGGRFPRGFEALGDPNEMYVPRDFAGNPAYDGRFTFARIRYRGYGRWSGREGPGWSHDYPDAEVHLMRLMRELTTMRPFTNKGPIVGSALVALDDPLLFKYPVAYLSEPGGLYPNPAELHGLRTYLLKGGFIIVDDLPAFDGWNQLVNVMARAFPELRPIELTGKEPIFDAFYKVDLNKVERGDYGPGTFYGWFENNDPKKRLMMVANYNQDVGESWQWSAQGFYAVDFSNETFKLGINYLIYALTH